MTEAENVSRYLAENLTALRKRKELSQERLAERRRSTFSWPEASRPDET